jgi:GrpB-like predicted nucleotidyltransferase (UPF0157 family)
MSSEPVEVAQYDEAWHTSFQNLCEDLARTLGSAARAIHHIGSTSIPGMRAKPIIDVLVEATELHLLDELTPALERFGNKGRGEYGIPGRRYFSRSATAEIPPVHTHVFRSGDPQVSRHLLFRDFLRRHPNEAREYSELKSSLVAAHDHNREAYQAGKAGFIAAIDRRAAEWASASAPAHVDNIRFSAASLRGLSFGNA